MATRPYSGGMCCHASHLLSKFIWHRSQQLIVVTGKGETGGRPSNSGTGGGSLICIQRCVRLIFSSKQPTGRLGWKTSKVPPGGLTFLGGWQLLADGLERLIQRRLWSRIQRKDRQSGGCFRLQPDGSFSGRIGAGGQNAESESVQVSGQVESERRVASGDQHRPRRSVVVARAEHEVSQQVDDDGRHHHGQHDHLYGAHGNQLRIHFRLIQLSAISANQFKFQRNFLGGNLAPFFVKKIHQSAAEIVRQATNPLRRTWQSTAMLHSPHRLILQQLLWEFWKRKKTNEKRGQVQCGPKSPDDWRKVCAGPVSFDSLPRLRQPPDSRLLPAPGAVDRSPPTFAHVSLFEFFWILSWCRFNF